MTIAGRVALVSMRPEAPAGRRLHAACVARGLHVVALRPAALPSAVARLDLALCRLPSGLPPWGLDALRAAEDAGLPLLDPPARLARAHDKRAALHDLAAAGLPVPATRLVLRDAPLAPDELPADRLVVKPSRGAAGRGVVTALDRKAAAARAAAFAEAAGAALVQEHVGDGTDRRLLVVDGAIVAAMVRRPAAPDGRGSLHYGAHASPFTPDAQQRDLALAAADALGLSIAGVDLLRRNDGRPVVLEVNTCPGLLGIEAATGADVAGAIADLLVRTLRAR